MKNINISHELFTNFNDITYYDEPHKYFLGDQQLISVTTLIHKYQKDFDEDYWAQYKADQYNITSDEVKRIWRFLNKKGTMKGSIIHDYIENILLNKVFKYPKDEIIRTFGFDPILKEYEITKKHADDFYTDIQGKLIPIKTELVVYDKETLVSGMLDILFYNVKAKEYQIWDNKTNKKLSYDNNWDKLLGGLSDLDDCDIEIYSLQLELYKRLIEKNTSIKLGKSYLSWFSHNNPTYKIIETKDRSKQIDMILNERINKLKLVA